MSTPSMVERLRSHDWASSPLGPMDAWPSALRIAVGICMSSRLPMFVWWGPELVNIYNDAYVPILGDKHPKAFGQPAQPTWSEIWDVVGPQADIVMKQGQATWNERVLLVMQRHGYTEDTWFTWSYSPIWDEAGRVAGLFCACTEETARVVAERERDELLVQVENERTRLHQAFAQSPSFLAILRGPTHVFEYVNDKYYDILGRRELIGRTVREAVPEVAGQGFFEIIDRVYATGEPFVGSDMRLMVARQPGEEMEEAFIDFVYQPVRDSEGTITGILAHGVDVTVRHRAERGLRERERSFRDLADSMPQIVFSATADGHVDYFNRQWYEYTGLREGDIGFDSWRHVHTPEGLARTMEAWNEATRLGKPYEIEYALRRHDGEFRWHLGRALPVRDESGRVVRWYGTNTDIHDRRQIEEALGRSLGAEQAARHDAELASRMKDEFLATLSHELRTPLNAILGWAHMIRRDDVTPREYARAAEVIERNARAQSRIIEDLLDMSAIISGKVRLEFDRLDLPAVVRAAIDTARPTADAKHIRLRTHLDRLEGIEMTGDAHRMQQVLWNLLTNALKFTPGGGEISVALRRADGHVEIAVADTGQGLSAAFLPHVFDRFRQADASTTRQHGGLGLGLAIAKQLVELHGGAIRAQSRGAGQGATFTVSLPIAAAAATVPRAQAMRRAPEAGAPVAAADCSTIAGKRVLIVDDEADARELMRELLEHCRADVVTASSSEEALRAASRERFDVLVSDIGMPGEDGYAFIRRLRATTEGGNATIPAMALTAYARPEDEARALAAGFQLHAAKPIDPAELIALVASLAQRAA